MAQMTRAQALAAVKRMRRTMKWQQIADAIGVNIDAAKKWVKLGRVPRWHIANIQAAADRHAPRAP